MIKNKFATYVIENCTEFMNKINSDTLMIHIKMMIIIRILIVKMIIVKKHLLKNLYN